MITLIITTERVFKSKEEYKDYKEKIKEYMYIDWRQLEREGFSENQQHVLGENVITRFELKDYEKDNKN